jgi:dolichol-phosphate mannosyltransferase/undecaprenyl-phosphate 4-deoxy-4-formamido-L-arabinose transferase
MTEVNEGPDYSVVVPVFESTHSIIELVDRLAAVFRDVLNADHEVILVDDGSRTPETWSICESLAGSRPSVTAVRLTRNYGKPGAVLCGLAQARGRFVVTIDDDLQQRPEDVPELAKLKDHDVVVARLEKRRHGPLVLLSSWLKDKFDRLILGIPCRMSPLKLFKAEVARGMLQITTPYPFIPALMSQITDDFVSVRLEHQPSRHGPSRYSFRRRFLQFSNLLISNSTILLRSLGIVGFSVSGAGFAFALTVLARRLYGVPTLTGWASLVVINLLFGGLTLIALGVVGEYLLRILEGVSSKPAYHVRTVLSSQARPRSETGGTAASSPTPDPR